MNNKTAKLINVKAKEYAKAKGMPVGWAQRQLKKLWRDTPRNKKHLLGI